MLIQPVPGGFVELATSSSDKYTENEMPHTVLHIFGCDCGHFHSNVLLCSCAQKADRACCLVTCTSLVAAFGITLWEMYTGARAFEGVPRALLGHQITREHKRPRFPDSTPWAYRDLAERCWQPNWQER
jgi:hypothetical protein